MLMRIRLATPEDLTGVMTFEPHLSPEKVAGVLRERHEYLLYDAEDGRVYGVLRYILLWQQIPFIEHVYLVGRVRDRDYGTMLVRYWEGEMKRLRYAHVMASTQSDETAWRFFEKIGYTRVGDFLPPGQYAREWVYAKGI